MKTPTRSRHDLHVARWTTLPQNGWEPNTLKFVERLGRYIDTRYESETCVFCGREIDPEQAYHKTICRRCA